MSVNDDLLPELRLRYSRFHREIQAGSHAGAVAEFQRLTVWLGRRHLKMSNDVFHWLYLGWLDVMWRCRLEHRMLDVFDDYLALCPSDDETHVWRATILFHLCRFTAAAEVLERYAAEGSTDPRVYSYLAGLAEREHNDELADDFHRHSYELDRAFPPPAPLSEEEAHDVFRQCLATMPADFREAVAPLPVFVSPLPDDELLFSCDPPLDPWTLGDFSGSPCSTEDAEPPPPPPIMLFSRNIGRLASRGEDLAHEMRSTLFHDIGCHFGLAEEEQRIEEADQD